MIFDRVAATAVALILLTPCATSAGFDEGVLIVKSPQLEQTVSHILVGRLNAFHETKAATGRYVAEVAVSGVEKGAGIHPGDLIYVHFDSPLTLSQIKAQRVVSNCGERKIDPLPKDWMRLYTQLDENFQYVADYPSCFFAVGTKAPAKAPRSLTDIIPPRLALMIASGFLAGFVVGVRVRARNRFLTRRLENASRE